MRNLFSGEPYAGEPHVRYKESLIIANSDHLDKIDKSKRQKNIRRAFAEDHLDIVLVNFPVLITKTCKLDTILSKW